MTWIFLGLATLFMVGLLISTLRNQHPPAPRNQTQLIAETNLGISEPIDAENGGVTFNNVYPPDSPADKAGLVGGDVLTAINGQTIKNTGAMLNVLRDLPAGKTTEVVYLRDSETRKTSLTTISREQFESLAETFETRGIGYGALGFEYPVNQRVAIAGKNISGVKLSTVSASGPAALAGIQQGDVVIEFDGVPIRHRGEFLMRVRRAIPYSTVTVVVIRGDKRMEIPVKMGKR